MVHVSSQEEVRESLDALIKMGWEVDPAIRDLTLGRATAVSDRTVRVGSVTYHIPYLESVSRHVLWKCHWPDCTNCCERQGRLPLTSDDLITIGSGMKYARVSEFVAAETIISTWGAQGQSGSSSATMTSINLKRSAGETAAQDGTRIPCRFLGSDSACTLHPGRPGVCYLYPFTTWLESNHGVPQVHATFQFTGDCPGFYLAESIDDMRATLEEYAGIIHGYNMAYARTQREGYASSAMD